MHFAAHTKTCLVQAICSDAFSPLWAGVGNLAPSNKYLAMVVLAPTIKYKGPTTKYKIPTTLSTRYNHQLPGKSHLCWKQCWCNGERAIFRHAAPFLHASSTTVLWTGSNTWYVLLGTCYLVHGILYLVLPTWYMVFSDLKFVKKFTGPKISG